MKKVLKTLLYLIITVIIAFIVFLIYASADDYKPQEKTSIFTSENPDLLSDTAVYSVLIWNIGYCGLNKEADFFYDGGKNVRPYEEKVKENIRGVKSFLQKNSDNDFILLQEVDSNSKRSYYFNEFDTIFNIFTDRTCVYGKNYYVFFVPTPLIDPIGKVNSGLMTISKYTPESSFRYSFPGNYSWPANLFVLDRCFLVNRYKLVNNKELLIINTHNSAYNDGTLKAQQMTYLKTFLKNEYKKGNYIIVAGDWNQLPLGFKPEFKENIADTVIKNKISPDYLPGWNWLYDNTLPTNRQVNAPYKKGKTQTTVIDFLLLSPNIKGVSVKNINTNFEFSDHNPVTARFILR